jgi:hypothetical protein
MYGMNKLSLLLLSILTLAACGGGGGGGSTPPQQGPTTPPAQPPAVEFTLPTYDYNEGDTVTITASVDTNAAATYQWRQIGGPLVNMQIDGNVMSFVAPAIHRVPTQTFDFTVVATVNNVSSDVYGVGVYVDNNMTFSDFSNEVALMAMGTTESAVQLLEAARVAVAKYHNNDDPMQHICQGNDAEFTNLEDNDNSGDLSAGDSIEFGVTECYSALFDAQVYGRIMLDFDMVDLANQQIEGRASFAEFFIRDYSSGVFNIIGEMRFGMSETALLREFVFSPVDQIDFSLNSVVFASITDLQVVKQHNLNTARFAVSIDGEVNDLLTDFTYQIDQVTPFDGYLNSLPTQGRVAITDGQETVTIDVDTNAGIEWLEVATGPWSEEMHWRDTVEGPIFGLNAYNNVEAYNGNEFLLVGELTPIFGVNNDEYLLRYLFNRPLQARDNMLAELNGFDGNSQYHEILVPLEVDGATLTFTRIDQSLLPANITNH